MNDFCISNTDNVLLFGNLQYKQCTRAFRKIVFIYFTQCRDIRDKNIVNVGLVTLTNIFCILLLHTNNLPLVFYHSEKTILYYFEFIEQISSGTSSFHSTLDLNVNDAKLFVYKKTLYDVTNIKDLAAAPNLFFNRFRMYANVLVAFFQILVTRGFIKSVVSEYTMLNERLDTEFSSNAFDKVITYDTSSQCDFNDVVNTLLSTMVV